MESKKPSADSEKQPKPSVPEVVVDKPVIITPKPQPSPQFVDVPNHFVLAILSMQFCWPLAIPALINANSVNTLLLKNDVDGARVASKKAKVWSIWAFVTGLVILPMLAFGFMMVLAIIIAATALSAPLHASNDELAYISDGNTDAAYNMTTSEYQAMVTKTDFEDTIMIYENLPLTTANLDSRNSDSNSVSSKTASYNYTVTSDGQEYVVNTYLVLVDDMWKIQDITIEQKPV
jgi:hypothetical protein